MLRATHDAIVAAERATTERREALIERLEAKIMELYGQIDLLFDHRKRIERAEHGLSEVPRQPKPEDEPMPKELRAYYLGFSNKALGRKLMQDAFGEYAKTRSWDTVMETVFAPPETDPETENDEIFDDEQG